MHIITYYSPFNMIHSISKDVLIKYKYSKCVTCIGITRCRKGLYSVVTTHFRL